MVTIQYTVLSTGAVKEKSFKTEAAMIHWVQMKGGAIEVLRYSYGA